MIIAGLDPSLSNFGLAKGVYSTQEGTFTLDQLSLVQTAPDNKTKVVRKNSDDLTRAKSLYESMTSFVSDCDLVMAEIPVGSQSARAMSSYGICIGLLASLQKPLIQITPSEVKLAATGNKNATKADMIAWAVETYPNVDWLTTKRNNTTIITAKNEHLADAVAAIHAGLTSDLFKQLLTFNQAISS